MTNAKAVVALYCGLVVLDRYPHPTKPQMVVTVASAFGNRKVCVPMEVYRTHAQHVQLRPKVPS